MSIHWEFSAPDLDAPGVRRVVEALRAAADQAGFADVGPVIEAHADRTAAAVPPAPDASPPDAPFDENAAADRGWALAQGLITNHTPDDPTTPGRMLRHAPAHVVVFRATHPGAEDAAFGLARYAPAAGLGNTYRWSSGCSTQGAAKRGGMPAFLRAHRAVISVLDKARSLGLKVTVRDDGGYWEHRDPKRLLDKLEEWETLLAALASRKRHPPTPPPTLASDVRDKLAATKRTHPRLDRNPIEGLEG